MTRHTPPDNLIGVPCSICAVSCAYTDNLSEHEPARLPSDTEKYLTKLKPDGYASLSISNAFIRNNLSVKRRKDYKRGERPLLKDLHLDGRAIVCIYGHFVYLDHEEYWSFFNNEDDEVVTFWELK